MRRSVSIEQKPEWTPKLVADLCSTLTRAIKPVKNPAEQETMRECVRFFTNILAEERKEATEQNTPDWIPLRSVDIYDTLDPKAYSPVNLVQLYRVLQSMVDIADGHLLGRTIWTRILTIVYIECANGNVVSNETLGTIVSAFLCHTTLLPVDWLHVATALHGCIPHYSLLRLLMRVLGRCAAHHGYMRLTTIVSLPCPTSKHLEGAVSCSLSPCWDEVYGRIMSSEYSHYHVKPGFAADLCAALVQYHPKDAAERIGHLLLYELGRISQHHFFKPPKQLNDDYDDDDDVHMHSIGDMGQSAKAPDDISDERWLKACPSHIKTLDMYPDLKTVYEEYPDDENSIFGVCHIYRYALSKGTPPTQWPFYAKSVTAQPPSIPHPPLRTAIEAVYTEEKLINAVAALRLLCSSDAGVPWIDLLINSNALQCITRKMLGKSPDWLLTGTKASARLMERIPHITPSMMTFMKDRAHDVIKLMVYPGNKCLERLRDHEEYYAMALQTATVSFIGNVAMNRNVLGALAHDAPVPSDTWTSVDADAAVLRSVSYLANPLSGEEKIEYVGDAAKHLLAKVLAMRWTGALKQDGAFVSAANPKPVEEKKNNKTKKPLTRSSVKNESAPVDLT
jgi:hypothetical protein